ncbi:MAG TPA: NUDIX hydrolase [Elusimicrobia bacterium]|jgi:ADP-ribose pyrophosphatase YjhB (NUDIX family)|nr:NUDIX hydrolase [Elusimicrobiota bacterium]
MVYEFSAGGLVIDNGKVLIIKTKNLKGDIVHTFPKGKIAQGEKPEDAALREVQEETGYQCEIIKRIDKVEYFYKREGQLIKKAVYWFLMKPLEGTGEHDKEILDVFWRETNEAEGILTYKSDGEMLKKWLK